LKALASGHFDRLAALISEAAERRGTAGEDGPPPRRTATDPGEMELLEAHGAVAELLDRLDDERDASRTTVETLEGKIRELRGSRRHAGAGNDEDLERLRRQLAERERTILDLGREVRNLDELRSALEDRTERLAQREQEVELLTHRLAVRNHMTALRMSQGEGGERESSSRH
ncbi:MAG TPA: hypothetical protein VGP38_07090, partial [Rubrobacter sp.]|nr:hypothetical protein [Rubrobacter sp.]